eukprot:gb/GFBE01008688.1/.p1 GENE.gb/GFBE01008688.1/~~gb/GFBE01008688.1/.p1  ORF type:complete len:321 (+),score=39.66 gb/GFBE01008688.1/:1-963(+)
MTTRVAPLEAKSGDSAVPQASMRYTKQTVKVFGKMMSYVEVGSGDPIVFVHGNPTSSYMWRNVLPHCEGLGRLIAPDLIGMGDSDKLDHVGPGSYHVPEHYEFFDAMMEALGVQENVTLVCHSWGGVIGSHWANLHRNAMRGIVTMEAPLLPFESWSSMPKQLALVFRLIKSCFGWHLVVRKNVMIEGAIPSGVIRKLSPEEHDEYRRPFLEGGEARRPLLSFARAVPVAGKPADVVAMMKDAREWLGTSTMPKLLLKGDPGSSLTEEEKVLFRSFPSASEVVVKGKHLITEDSPDAVGQAIAQWYTAAFNHLQPMTPAG